MTSTINSRLFLSPPHITERESELINEALRSNYVAPIGPMVDRFEADLKSVTGISEMLAVSSGTAALHLALRIADVSHGDIVWASTLTFIGGIAPINYQGASPVFFDCDSHGLIDLDLVEAQLPVAEREGTIPKALIVTDLYGLVVPLARARALCDRYGIVLILDAAESLGSERGLTGAASLADFVILSFNGNKIITTSGGGALGSQSAENIAKARFLSTQAREQAAHYEHVTFGYNYRLSNISSAIGCAQLESLTLRVARRRQIHAFYRDAFNNIPSIRFVEDVPGTKSNRWLTTISIDPNSGVTSTQAYQSLEAQNIEARPVWKPMHMQPVYASARFCGSKVAERQFAHGLCLPSGTGMTDNDLDRVATTLRACFS